MKSNLARNYAEHISFSKSTDLVDPDYLYQQLIKLAKDNIRFHKILQDVRWIGVVCIGVLRTDTYPKVIYLGLQRSKNSADHKIAISYFNDGEVIFKMVYLQDVLNGDLTFNTRDNREHFEKTISITKNLKLIDRYTCL